jgi:2-polyprenyl-6-methoxyphenol hydroxylase-like FAD-dependent oxidoreductase
VIYLGRARRIAIIGGGVAVRFAALMLRRLSSPTIEMLVLEDTKSHYLHRFG